MCMMCEIRDQLDPLVERFNDDMNAANTQDEKNAIFSDLLHEVFVMGLEQGATMITESLKPVLAQAGMRIEMFKDGAEANLFAAAGKYGGDVIAVEDGQVVSMTSVEADKHRLL